MCPRGPGSDRAAVSWRGRRRTLRARGPLPARSSEPPAAAPASPARSSLSPAKRRPSPASSDVRVQSSRLPWSRLQACTARAARTPKFTMATQLQGDEAREKMKGLCGGCAPACALRSRVCIALLLAAMVPLAASSAAGGGRPVAPRPSPERRGAAEGEEEAPPSALSTTIATLGNLVPRFEYTLKPETLLKIRKRFRPLMTELTVGGDFDPQHNVWVFRTDWTENLLGGNLALIGPTLQWSKALFFPGIADVATRVKFVASVDLRTVETKTAMEVSLRRASVFARGLQLERQVPLDGLNGHFKLGLVGTVEFPDTIGLSGSAAGLNASEVMIGLHLKRLDLLVDF
ncbi:hypothetical protein T492DRAFT_1037110 [Pavlovales sp. CCMP2436]|nr:hypothetical protein T492DRAFT_1037110 [Pavlovales sp. CCMP2436]